MYLEVVSFGKIESDSITYQISLAAGLGLILYAIFAGGDVWKEFLQYFRESKLVSVFISLFHMCVFLHIFALWFNIIRLQKVVHFTPSLCPLPFDYVSVVV